MRIYADDLLWQQIVNDRSLEQAVNVTTLPGVTGCVYAMPDVHEGYGFPVGGVAAMEADDGVIHEWRAGGAGERLVEQAGAALLVCGVRS